MSANRVGCFRIVAIASSIHGWPRCAITMLSRGKARATASSVMGRAHSSGASRTKVVPWCHMTGSLSSSAAA